MAIHVDVELLTKRKVKMRTYFYIIVVLLGLMSCDHSAYYDYYVINQCDETIDVYIESDWENYNYTNSIVIPPHETVLVYHGEWINGVKGEMVERIFKKITIHKGDEISKVNYIDKDKWGFEPTSDSHANSYLTVYPEDFEN